MQVQAPILCVCAVCVGCVFALNKPCDSGEIRGVASRLRCSPIDHRALARPRLARVPLSRIGGAKETKRPARQTTCSLQEEWPRPPPRQWTGGFRLRLLICVWVGGFGGGGGGRVHFLCRSPKPSLCCHRTQQGSTAGHSMARRIEFCCKRDGMDIIPKHGRSRPSRVSVLPAYLGRYLI